MNERIRELAEQAEILVTEVGAFHNTPAGAFQLKGEHLTKFAELIVQECADIVNSLEQHQGPGDCSTAEYIKERFGVE